MGLRIVLKEEIKHNVNRVSGICLLAFLIFSCVILQVGIERFKTDRQHHTDFINNELQKVNRYINVKQYGAYGIRRLLKASPLFALFFNSTAVTELQAFFDVGVRLELSKPEIGKCRFEKSSGGILDYSWWLLSIGSLIVMIWGFFAYRSKEYLKFLMTFASIRSVHWGIIIGRIILIATALLIMVFMIWLQYLLNGISITGDISSLLVSFLVTLMALSFFLIVSAGLGAVKKVKSTVYRGVTAALIWLIFVLLCPEVINLVFSRIAEGSMKSFYNHENKKIKKLMEFEKDAYEKVKNGRYETDEEKFEVDKKSGEIWWEEFKREIEPLENEMIKQSDKIARNFQFWCSFTPVTFCKSVNNETSSKGLNSSSKFHKDNLEKQRGFLRYYLDKRFYENYSQQESYLTKDEVIIIAKSSLPDYFAVGLIWNFFLIIAASCFGYFRFKRWMLKEEGESEIGEFKFNIKKGKNNYLVTAEEGFRTQIFNYFSNLGKSSLIIQIDGKPQQKGENEFIYLCSPSRLPFGVSAKSLYKMLYKKKCIEDLKIWEVMFRYAVESKRLIILDNFFKGLKGKEVENILRVIRKEDVISLYIGDNYYEAEKLGDDEIIYSLDDTSIDAIVEIAEVVKNSLNVKTI